MRPCERAAGEPEPKGSAAQFTDVIPGSYYEKAVKGKDPFFTPIALFKLGQMYERKGDWKKALDAYETIEKDFYTEYNKMSVAQYVERAKANVSK